MIKIMVDSASDLKDGRNYDYFIPISITLDNKEYLDGVDFETDAFYEMLISTKDFPRTSQPSPQVFIEIFEEVKNNKDELIYFSLSSALSGTYQGALMAKEIVDYEKIYIVDTKAATHLIGVLAEYANKLVAENFTAEEIVEKCENLKSKIKAFAGLDTLEYLKKGGRLSGAAATVGTLAHIKPIVTISDEGKVVVAGKALGKGKAIQFISDKIQSYNIDTNFPIYSLYSFGEENCKELEDKLKIPGYKIKSRLQVGSTIGAHIGPGAFGIMFVEK